MDYAVNKDTLTVRKVIFDGCKEQPIDLDFNLPDYCPDIRSILKCQIYPQINMKNILADRLDVEGTIIIKILYVDSLKAKIRCCEHSLPFSCSFDLNETAEDAVATLKCKVEYVNCRATSPRKLDIHGAFSVCAKVCQKSQQEIVTEIDGNDLQQKKENVQTMNVAGIGQQQFSINEVLEIGKGKPQAQAIIRTDKSAILNDYKAIANKLIAKGEILLKILYLSDIEESNLETMEYSIPISQIIDVQGLDENSTCDVTLNIMNEDIHIRTDASEENHLFEVDLKILATVTAYSNKNFDLITDAYSIKYELESSREYTDVETLLDCISNTFTEKNIINLSNNGISKIIDVFNETNSINAKKEDDQIKFSGKMNVCVLALDEEDIAFYIEKVIDFEHNYNFDSPLDITCEANVNLISIGYRILNQNEIEVKAEMMLNANIYTNETYNSIIGISSKESSTKSKDSDAALTIYYADSGENIWDIARKYSTSVDAIKLENDLADDIIEKESMLLIPM